MRVISGKAKGRKLNMVPGDTTRPILDRAKENLFNILRSFVPGTRWLDLFAGTGQIGIEALSRGAAEVVFTDSARTAVRTIEENLALTQLADGTQVYRTDAFAYLKRVQAEQITPFDLIYVAPPQYKRLWSETLSIIDGQVDAFLVEGGMIVVQIDPKEFEPLDLQQLVLVDERRYGRTLFAFYEPLLDEPRSS